RIGCGIAVAGKMLGSDQHSGGVRAANVGGNEIGDLLRIFAKGTRIDDGVIGSGIDVGYREKIPMHTDGASLLASDSSEIFCELRVPAGANGHRVGESGGSVQAVAHAQLEIGSNKQRKLGVTLQPIQKFSRFVRFVLVDKR